MEKEKTLAEGLMELVETEATTLEGRNRVARSLCRTLRAMSASGAITAAICPLCDADRFVTRGTAEALAGMATGLQLAADSARHLADHAAVIAPPPHRRPEAA